MTDIFGDWNSFEQIDKWMEALSADAVNLLLTKRPERMFEYLQDYFHADWDSHLWWGITIEDSCEYWRRFGYLRIPYQTWVSAEPLLSDIDIEEPLGNWLVIGAESGSNARSCKLEWVRHIVSVYREQGIPVFVKQLQINGKLVRDIEQFPEDLQIRQVPWNR